MVSVGRQGRLPALTIFRPKSIGGRSRAARPTKRRVPGLMMDRGRTRPVVFALILLLAACEGGPALSDPSPAPVTADSANANQDPCATYPPSFEASYLPAGFVDKLRPGAGLFKGTDYPTEGLVGHYLGKYETNHINFQVKGGPLPYEPANPHPIEVLGSSGLIGKIEGGFSVEFTFRNCDFRMDTYGISREQTRRVADGLRKRP